MAGAAAKRMKNPPHRDDDLTGMAEGVAALYGRDRPWEEKSDQYGSASGRVARAASDRHRASSTAAFLSLEADSVVDGFEGFERQFAAAEKQEQEALQKYSELEWIVRAGSNPLLVGLVLTGAVLYAVLAWLAAQSVNVSNSHDWLNQVVRVIIGIGAASLAAAFEFAAGTLGAWAWRSARSDKQRAALVAGIILVPLVLLVVGEWLQADARAQAQLGNPAPPNWMALMSIAVLFVGSISAMLRALYVAEGEPLLDEVAAAREKQEEIQERVDDKGDEVRELRERAHKVRADAEAQYAAAIGDQQSAELELKAFANRSAEVVDGLTKKLDSEAQLIYRAAAQGRVMAGGYGASATAAGVALVGGGVTIAAASGAYMAAGAVPAAICAGLALAIQGGIVLLQRDRVFE